MGIRSRVLRTYRSIAKHACRFETPSTGNAIVVVGRSSAACAWVITVSDRGTLAVPFFEEFVDYANEQVTVHRYVGVTPGGDPVDSGDSVYQAYIEEKVKRITTEDGTEKVTSHVVYLMTVDDIHPESRITLPVGFKPRERLAILSMARYRDEQERSHVVLYV